MFGLFLALAAACDKLDSAEDGGSGADTGGPAEDAGGGGEDGGGGFLGDRGSIEDTGAEEDAGAPPECGNGKKETGEECESDADCSPGKCEDCECVPVAACEPGAAPTLTWTIDTTETLTQAINDVHVLPDGTVIAGGDDGMFITFDGTAWTEKQINQNAITVTCIWGSAKDNVYAFGNHAYHYNGTDWTEITAWHVGDTCQNIWGKGTDDIWLTQNGHVMHYTGGAFVDENIDAATAAGMVGVWGFANGHIYASGTGSGGPNYIWFDGTAWKPLTDKQGTNSNDVFGLTEGDIWFSGHFSDVFHWNGATLEEHTVGPGMEDFGTIRAGCKNQVYVLSDRNSASSRGIYLWDGVAWTEPYDGNSADIKQLRDMEMMPDGRLLVVGQDAANKALVLWGTP
jgi:hypothetical protein